MEDLLKGSCQLILVKNRSWDSSEAVFQLYERQSPNEKWKAVSEEKPAVTGKKGMAIGLRDKEVRTSEEKDRKREGDLKAPSGIFPVTHVFGYSEEPPAPALKPIYLHLTENEFWVDDPDSPYYNQLVNQMEFKKPFPWKSAERMLREDGLYKYGLIIGYNKERIPGNGSAIFLHIWRSPDSGTEGCTAVSEENILQIIKWLRPDRKPVVLQLVQQDIEMLKYLEKIESL